MEIEAKFRVPDEETLQRLLEVPALVGYALGPAYLIELRDYYLDTPGMAFSAAGLAFRFRQGAERTIATLKGLGQAAGGIHRRAEYEVELPTLLMPGQWPASPIRDAALQICGSEPLELLFVLDQRRLTRQVSEGERIVADLSGDRVQVRASSGVLAPGTEASSARGERAWKHSLSGEAGTNGCQIDDSYLELEIELLAAGTELDLAALSKELRRNWRLQPVAESKFHRALTLLYAARPSRDSEMPSPPHLAPHEREYLARLARERATLSRRARLLLAWDEGVSVAEMSERSGLSARRARYWRQAFRQRRMAVFPKQAIEPSARPEPSQPASATGSPPPQNSEPHVEPTRRAPETAEMATLPRRPGVRADDLMSEAGRKVLRFHFQRMLLHEPGTRTGEDIEALHDMRVATRRMRAAFRIFGEYLERRSSRPLESALRRIARALGEVRDLDVFEEKTRGYQETLPDAQRTELERFLTALHAQRAAARERLLGRLDAAAYGRFVTAFSSFVEPPGTGSPAEGPPERLPEPRLVRHVAPMAIMERMAAIRAFEGYVGAPDTPLDRYHALRIATKRLRYALEFFLEVLGPECRTLVGKTVALQDHLGLLQDGVVASGILRDFLVWGTWGDASNGKKPQSIPSPVIAPGVALYLSVRQSEIQDLLAGFPAVWASITEPAFVRGVAAAVGAL